MTVDTLIMLSGAFILALPFLGFPADWDAVLLVCAGVGVIALGITVRRRGLKSKDSLPEKKPSLHDISAPAQPAASSNGSHNETA